MVDAGEQAGPVRGAGRRMLVSLLVFSGTANVLRLLRDLPVWLEEFALANRFTVVVTVRVNNPALDTEQLRDRIRLVNDHPGAVSIVLIEGGPNLGFGAGHNENYRSSRADFLLVLNDDLLFPDLQWLPTAIGFFDADETLAILGDAENPQLLSPFFANGTFPTNDKLYPLRYGEASVLLVRGTAFEAIGMFDQSIEWAMSEDSDLSLKAQQAGYRIDWMPIPHEHWRSTSFLSLPPEAKSSVKEHNRARLFAKWGHSISAGKIGRISVLDVFSDGIGDVFCALFHVCAELDRLPEQQRASVVVNTSHPDLARILLPDGIAIDDISDVQAIHEKYKSPGIANIRSTRDANYALPFNIHAAVSSILSVPFAAQSVVDTAIDRMRRKVVDTAGHGLVPDEPYCVVHAEFNRAKHDGRGPAASITDAMVRSASRKFGKAVVVGIERWFDVSCENAADGDVIDLQGQLDLPALLSVILSAKAFVGIDSFPAHVAQMAGIPSAVFFGSVHPLARVWSERRTWPIHADLDCIGCYHKQIEPGIPYCMRRDFACTEQISAAEVERSVGALASGTRFDWTGLRKSFEHLQSKWLHLLAYHPAPPAHFLRHTLPNETVSNLIYEITERIASVSGRYTQSTIIEGLRTENRALKAKVMENDFLSRSGGDRGRKTEGAAAAAAVNLDLKDLIRDWRACSIRFDELWAEITCFGGDPQIDLAPLIVGKGAFQVDVTATATEKTHMRLYWWHTGERPSEDQAVSLTLTTFPKKLTFDQLVRPNRMLHLRLDPAERACVVRLRGSMTAERVSLARESGIYRATSAMARRLGAMRR